MDIVWGKGYLFPLNIYWSYSSIDDFRILSSCPDIQELLIHESLLISKGSSTPLHFTLRFLINIFSLYTGSLMPLFVGLTIALPVVCIHKVDIEYLTNHAVFSGTHGHWAFPIFVKSQQSPSLFCLLKAPNKISIERTSERKRWLAS